LNILLSCDDGIKADGTLALAALLAEMGQLRCCAPQQQHSGSGHAVTLHKPISAKPAQVPGCTKAIAVRGTPADSVKLALTELWPGWADVVLSGINSGPNVGVNVFYSGTVGAAAEAALLGVPALAVSLDVTAPFDFKWAAEHARPVLQTLLSLLPFPPGMLFNINIPGAEKEILGPRLTRQGRSGFREYYTPAPSTSESPGERAWNIDGDFQVLEPEQSYDAAALAAGWISVTPMNLDLTISPLRKYDGENQADYAEILKALAAWQG